MNQGMKIALTANAEVVTGAEMATMKALNGIESTWTIPHMREFLSKLRELGFEVRRT